MTVNKVIIHELVKETRENAAEVYLSANVLGLTSDVISLVETLDKSYQKDTINYAVFNTAPDRNFPRDFSSYESSHKADIDFITFTTATISNLRGEIANVTLAKGGYFIYADYEHSGNRFVGIYLVRYNSGIRFSRNASHGFDISNVTYMNTDKLAMGCRINCSKYSDESGSYLSLIKNRQSDISEYFYNWISVLQPESSVAFTKTLFDIVTNIPPPTDTVTHQEISIDQFRQRVFDYISSQTSPSVNLKQMGLHFFNDEDRFISYAEQNDMIIDSEFKVSTKGLKRFIQVDVKADGINLKFSRGELDAKVRFSDDPNQIIIESERFVRALRRELNDE